MKSEELAFESMYLSVLGMTENGWQAEKDPEQQHEYRSQQEFHTVFHAVASSVIDSSADESPYSLARKICASVNKRNSNSSSRAGRSILVWITARTMTELSW